MSFTNVESMAELQKEVLVPKYKKGDLIRDTRTDEILAISNIVRRHLNDPRSEMIYQLTNGSLCSENYMNEYYRKSNITEYNDYMESVSKQHEVAMQNTQQAEQEHKTRLTRLQQFIDACMQKQAEQPQPNIAIPIDNRKLVNMRADLGSNEKCKHKWVEMIYGSYCKYCNADKPRNEEN